MRAERGYAKLYMRSVLQAEEGCDFDFLQKSLSRLRRQARFAGNSTRMDAPLIHSIQRKLENRA